VLDQAPMKSLRSARRVRQAAFRVKATPCGWASMVRANLPDEYKRDTQQRMVPAAWRI